jgi:hypothetical protein
MLKFHVLDLGVGSPAGHDCVVEASDSEGNTVIPAVTRAVIPKFFSFTCVSPSASTGSKFYVFAFKKTQAAAFPGLPSGRYLLRYRTVSMAPLS